MITRQSSLVVAAISALLAVATSASAECAWVLWARWVGDQPYPDRAFTRPEACYAAIANTLERIKRDGDGGSIVIHGPDSAQYFQQGLGKVSVLKCLPDTVDPRGPKGSK